jgi:hypothetical protein
MSPLETTRIRMLRPLFLFAMALGSALITWGSASYFFGEDLHPFVLEKIETGRLADETAYVAVLRVHVVAAAFALPGCIALALHAVRRRWPRVHRWLGRATAATVLFALVPSGACLAWWARGGAPSTAGFLLSGGIAAFAMGRGVRTARAGDFAAHRRCTAHVLAQLSVAVTSRALLVLLDRTSLDPDQAYVAALWLPVVGSALVAEALTGPVRRRKSGSWRKDHAVRDARTRARSTAAGRPRCGVRAIRRGHPTSRRRMDGGPDERLRVPRNERGVREARRLVPRCGRLLREGGRIFARTGVRALTGPC